MEGWERIGHFIDLSSDILVSTYYSETDIANGKRLPGFQDYTKSLQMETGTIRYETLQIKIKIRKTHDPTPVRPFPIQHTISLRPLTLGDKECRVYTTSVGPGDVKERHGIFTGIGTVSFSSL